MAFQSAKLDEQSPAWGGGKVVAIWDSRSFGYGPNLGYLLPESHFSKAE
jgi:hypothetical protein